MPALSAKMAFQRTVAPPCRVAAAVAAVGGTWLAKESLVISRAKAGIVAATREALACWNTPA